MSRTRRDRDRVAKAAKETASLAVGLARLIAAQTAFRVAQFADKAARKLDP